MTREEFHALELWVTATARLIAVGYDGGSGMLLQEYDRQQKQRRQDAYDLLVKT